MAVLRQVCRNVKRWRNARIGIAMDGTAMLEAEKSFRRLKGAQTASDSEGRSAATSALSQLPAKIGQLKIQAIAPAAPFSTGTGTIRDVVFQYA